MKKTIMTIAAAIALAACSSTFQGVKADSSRNYEKTADAVEKGWDAMKDGTGRVMEKTGSAVEKAGSSMQK